MAAIAAHHGLVFIGFMGAGKTRAADAVADVVHLIAELVENATVFSPPQTQVTLRTGRAGGGFVLHRQMIPGRIGAAWVRPFRRPSRSLAYLGGSCG